LFVTHHPPNPLRAFDVAVREKDADAALRAARLLLERHSERLPLDRALRLTLLLGESWDRRYHAAARRLLARVLEEVEPPMLEAKKFADALAHINHPGDYRMPARDGLHDCIPQLQRLELRIDFHSLPE
jgi:hypothetical protein